MVGVSAKLILAILPLIAVHPLYADESGPDQLKFLLAENTKSFEKIAWVSYHSEQVDISIRRGNESSRFEKDVIQKPPYRFVSSSSELTFPLDPSKNQSVKYKSVLGQEYFGGIVSGLGEDAVECIGHESPNQRSSRSIEYEGAFAGSELLYQGGFGIYNSSLGVALLDRSRPDINVEIEENKDGAVHVFVVRHRNTRLPPDHQILDAITFRADRGFLISHYSIYSEGHLLRDCAAEIGVFGAEKLPFPQSIIQNEYGPFKGSDGTIVWRQSSSFNAKFTNIVTLHPSATFSTGRGGNLPVRSSVRNASAIVFVASSRRSFNVR